MSVYKKLMAARIALQAEPLTKTGHNKFAGYNYFELGDFLPTVQTIFNSVGLCGVVSYSEDLATLKIFDVDGGEPIVITSPMGSAALKGTHEVQQIGAVETYQRRYLWVTAMEIVEHDALDAVTGKEPAKVQPKAAAKSEVLPPPMTQKEVDMALDIISGLGSIDEVKSLFGSAWKRATEDQKAGLKSAYEKRKAELSGGAA